MGGGWKWIDDSDKTDDGWVRVGKRGKPDMAAKATGWGNRKFAVCKPYRVCQTKGCGGWELEKNSRDDCRECGATLPARAVVQKGNSKAKDNDKDKAPEYKHNDGDFPPVAVNGNSGRSSVDATGPNGRVLEVIKGLASELGANTLSYFQILREQPPERSLMLPALKRLCPRRVHPRFSMP